MARLAEELPPIQQLPRRFEGMRTVADRRPDDLARALADVVDGEVRFDDGTRATYSTDASNYRQIPLGLVLPRTIEDVVAAVRVCRQHGAAITSRGGGTSLAGQACNSGVIIDFSKYLNHVTDLDPVNRLATVEPGCVLDNLREQAGRHGLTFGPDPATHDRNTLGGMIGNNSCGAHSVMSALFGPGPMTVHQIVELEVLTYDGRRLTVGAHDPEDLASIIASEHDPRSDRYRDLRRLRDEYEEAIRDRFPEIPRRASGFPLDWLLPENGFHVARSLVGTEGTCVIVLSATVELIEAKPGRTLVVAGYPDAASAADHVSDVIKSEPVALEGIDSELVGYMKKKGLHPDDVDMLPEGDGWLLIEFGGETKEESDHLARAFVDRIESSGDGATVKLFDDRWQEKKIWEVRESGLGATAHVPGMSRTHPGWEDAAVPPEKVGDYLRDFQALLDEFGYHAALYGHFGQGCVHCRIDFDFSTEAGVESYRRFVERAAHLVASYGGSLSGEHGDGQARAELLEVMYGPRLVEAFRSFKRIWDPDGMMNPGKVVDPAPLDTHLREGPEMTPVRVQTHFAFRDDDGDFAAAAARCVGVGKCRDIRSGTMCPSYMATREEEDSTRGRARLLFEMLQGDPIDDLWHSTEVREALDLCLACKGCKTECPVNVDMATYKAEFLSHHYQGRLRPRVAYSMGLIYWWARIASRFPRLVNHLTGNEPWATLAKKAAGVSPERKIPRFARPTLTGWFESRHRPGDFAPSGKVVLWPDTFNNFLAGGAGRAAVRVLEAAGFDVELPKTSLCCGRPLYDWGMLDRAKVLWAKTLETLQPQIEEGTPIVGLEPSCVASFRDELPGLFPDDPRARALADNTHIFSEFLSRLDWEVPRLERRALVQGHCHHKAILKMDDEVDLMDRIGLDYEILDSGCCGMAGAFGFDARHYEVSRRVGERVLLPRVAAAAPTTLIIANGFSCRQQIEQSTDRRAMHVAQAIELAMDLGPAGPLSGKPEDAVAVDEGSKARSGTNRKV